MPGRFLASARRDLFAAAAYYEAEAPGLGNKFLEAVDAVLEQLESFPRAGSPYEGTLRRVVLPAFPFSLIYELDVESVVIVAVAHQRRDPSSWRGRR